MPVQEIEEIIIPAWLECGTFQFNLNNVLRDSLYYPAAGLDGIPVRYFMGNIFSFVYVDYGIFMGKNKIITRKYVFKGYKNIHKQNISDIADEVDNYYNSSEYFEKSKIRRGSRNPKPYCYWLIFERLAKFPEAHNPKKFSLLYLCGEAISAYYALYINNKISPKILCIIQDGYRFGGGFTDFTDSNSYMAKAVCKSKNKLPKYLINGGRYTREYKDPSDPTPKDPTPYTESIWPEYTQKILQKKHRNFRDGQYSDDDCKLFTLWGKIRSQTKNA